MTLQDQIKAAEQAMELWAVMLPGVSAPEKHAFLLWMGSFRMDAVTRGINRAAAKYAKMARTSTPMNADACARYATSVMRAESQQQVGAQ